MANEHFEVSSSPWKHIQCMMQFHNFKFQSFEHASMQYLLSLVKCVSEQQMLPSVLRTPIKEFRLSGEEMAWKDLNYVYVEKGDPKN